MKSKILNPVIIIGCPRSGTTLLYTILSQSEHLYSLYNESRFVFKKFYQRKLKENKEYFTDALTESDIDDNYKSYLLNEFHKFSLNDRIVGLFLQKILRKNVLLKPIGKGLVELNAFYKNTCVPEYRFVEKTPRNCFKILFLNKLFPDAKFIYLKRDGRSNISSLIEGWQKRKGGKERFPRLNLPFNIRGYDGKSWHFALPPGWEEYREKSLEEVCAFQWISSNQAVVRDLRSVEDKRKCVISYEELSEQTVNVVKKVCEFVDIPFSEDLRKMAERPPVVNSFSKPGKDKWKKNAHLLENVHSMIEPTMNELGYKLGSKELIGAS